MRHTLLPPAERKGLRLEYRIRAGTVLLIAFSFAGLLGVGALFPAFLHSSNITEKALTSLKHVTTENLTGSTKDTAANLAVGRKLMSAISTAEPLHKVSAVIEEFMPLRGTLKISTMNVSVHDTAADIMVQGVAPTRQALIDFKSRIENYRDGASIDLPVSELARSTNISFALQIKFPLK